MIARLEMFERRARICCAAREDRQVSCRRCRTMRATEDLLRQAEGRGTWREGESRYCR